MPALIPDTPVVRSPTALAERVGDATVVLDPAADRYIRLNGTGGWVFGRLGDHAVSAAELAPAFADAFGVTHERALADVLHFLEDLCRRGLAARSRATPEVPSAPQR
jgi:hypothetical protein